VLADGDELGLDDSETDGLVEGLELGEPAGSASSLP